jgi:hypothetical protein
VQRIERQLQYLTQQAAADIAGLLRCCAFHLISQEVRVKEIAMQSIMKRIAGLMVVAGSLPFMAAHAATDAMSRAESRQLIEDKTPQAQYQTSRKEANAAYQEALAECRKMQSGERSGCMKEARSNLQNDLAEAKRSVSSGR